MDGWQQALGELARYFESAIAWDAGQAVVDRRIALSGATIPEAARQTVGGALESASTLGRRTAELHLTLAGGAARKVFGAGAVDAAWIDALVARARRQVDTTMRALATAGDSLPANATPHGTLAAVGEHLTGAIDELAARIPAGLELTRIHGAYDLGQVLLSEGDYVIIDFEGDPALPMDDRRRLDTPLRDVANMVRSLQYAAGVGLSARLTVAPQDGERMSAWARWWHTWTTASFLNAYRTTAAGAAFAPPDTPGFEAVLRLLLIDQSLTEVRRELDARPEYVWIPLQAVVELF
jgi:trehalose synthase-fused probable maltokinase